MTPEEREAVCALIAALPKCTWHCGKTASQERDVWIDEGNDYVGKDYACDEHACPPHHTTGTDPWIETSWATALRKLQAMLDQEETD